MSSKKSVSESHIDSSLKSKLGINQELKELDNEENSSNENKSAEDIEREIRAEERKLATKELKSQLSKLKKKESKDKEFCREMYKELAARGMTMLGVMQDEVELNPRARDMETASTMINSIASTLDSLRNIDDVDEKFSIEREKLGVKKQIAIGNDRYSAMAQEGTKAIVSSMADMIKQINKAKEQEDNTIEIEAEVKQDDKKGEDQCQ